MVNKKLSAKQVNDLTNKIHKLAEATGTMFDGSEIKSISESVSLHADEDRADIYAHLLTEDEYDAMEKDMEKFEIKGKGYEIYAWNDVSGYAYWAEEGHSGSSNYIQVTVNVKLSHLNKIDAKKLKSDVQKALAHFSHYDNKNEFYNQQYDKAEGFPSRKEILYSYKFRAECWPDVEKFIRKVKPQSFKIETIRAGLPDCVVEIQTHLSLEEILKRISRIVDGHVMVETLQHKSRYTGERLDNRRRNLN